MKTILCLLVIALFYCCEKNPGALQDEDENYYVAPEREVLAKFAIIQSSYDSLKITNKNDLILMTKSVEKIQIGKKTDALFEMLDETTPVYTGFLKSYHLKFMLSCVVPDTALYFPITIRFVLKDSSLVDFDSLALLYHYPYISTQIFMCWDELPENHYQRDIQDFDLKNDILYFHPYSSYGLYQYDLANKSTKELYDYGAGDFIVQDGDYVFMDVDHFRIYRYNLLTNESQKILEFSGWHTDDIWGLEAYHDSLFVLRMRSADMYPILEIYDYNARLLDSITNYNSHYYSFYLTIHDNVLYSGTGGPTLSRYDLKSRSYLDSRPKPSGDTEAIRFIDGFLYFTDYQRRYIGRTSMDEIINYSGN